MDKCSSCGRTEEEVKLFDALYVNDSVKMCERCSLINGVPLIKRPSASQLKDSEKPYAVRNRLARIAHLPLEQKPVKSAYEQLKEIESQPELEQPEDLVFKLVDNFHWIIQTERRRKGFSAKQLAEALHESESAINMLEKGIIPSKSLNLIQAIEQLLKVNLIKRDFMNRIEEQKRKNVLKVQNEMPAAEQKEVPGRITDLKIKEMQRSADRIEHDFAYPRKSWEQVGNEQVETMGKEDSAYLRKTIMKDSLKTRGNVPTIYDLMKKKDERDKMGVTGKDIELD